MIWSGHYNYYCILFLNFLWIQDSKTLFKFSTCPISYLCNLFINIFNNMRNTKQHILFENSALISGVTGSKLAVPIRFRLSKCRFWSGSGFWSVSSGPVPGTLGHELHHLKNWQNSTPWNCLFHFYSRIFPKYFILGAWKFLKDF